MNKLKIYKLLKWIFLCLAITTYLATTLFLIFDFTATIIIILYTIGSIFLLLFATFYILQIKLEDNEINSRVNKQKEQKVKPIKKSNKVKIVKNKKQDLSELQKLKTKNNLLKKLNILFFTLFVLAIIYCILSITINLLNFIIALILSIVIGFINYCNKQFIDELDTRISTIEINEYHSIMQNKLKNNDDDADELLKAYENFQQNSPVQNRKYKLKTKTITSNEQYFLDIIKKHFSNNYEIRPQVPLSSIIEKNKEHDWEYQNELNRIIDFGLFDKQSTAPLLLIEINDRTHHENKRKYRDQKVKEICEQAGIKLIAFWSEYSNTEQYIVERISKELNSD